MLESINSKNIVWQDHDRHAVVNIIREPDWTIVTYAEQFEVSELHYSAAVTAAVAIPPSIAIVDAEELAAHNAKMERLQQQVEALEAELATMRHLAAGVKAFADNDSWYDMSPGEWTVCLHDVAFTGQTFQEALIKLGQHTEDADGTQEAQAVK